MPEQTPRPAEGPDREALVERWRKQPVEIDAKKFDGTWESANAWLTSLGHDEDGDGTDGGPACHMNGDRLVIETLEGDMTASPGDWIIRGVQGEFYPCKPDIFLATYEPVEARPERCSRRCSEMHQYDDQCARSAALLPSPPAPGGAPTAADWHALAATAYCRTHHPAHSVTCGEARGATLRWLTPAPGEKDDGSRAQAASGRTSGGDTDLRGEQTYPRQRKGRNPFLPDAPVRKTFTDERVAEALDSWAADQRMRETWRDGDTNTYRYRANLLEAAAVRLRALAVRDADQGRKSCNSSADSPGTAGTTASRESATATGEAASPDVDRDADQGAGAEENAAARRMLQDERNAVVSLTDRLDKIAEWHRLDVDEHGGNTGVCNECGMPWPCATYCWATDDTAEPNCTWELDECEIHDHSGTPARASEPGTEEGRPLRPPQPPPPPPGGMQG